MLEERTDPFCVEIVRATTKIPFPQHVDGDGGVFVEVEPGVEFFIRVQNNCGQKVLVMYEVDGRGLRYCQPVNSGAREVGGIRSVRDGQKTKKALRFEKAVPNNQKGVVYDDYHSSTPKSSIASRPSSTSVSTREDNESSKITKSTRNGKMANQDYL